MPCLHVSVLGSNTIDLAHLPSLCCCVRTRTIDRVVDDTGEEAWVLLVGGCGRRLGRSDRAASVSGEFLDPAAASAGKNQGDLIAHRGRALSRKRPTSRAGVKLVAAIPLIAALLSELITELDDRSPISTLLPRGQLMFNVQMPSASRSLKYDSVARRSDQYLWSGRARLMGPYRIGCRDVWPDAARDDHGYLELCVGRSCSRRASSRRKCTARRVARRS